MDPALHGNAGTRRRYLQGCEPSPVPVKGLAVQIWAFCLSTSPADGIAGCILGL